MCGIPLAGWSVFLALVNRGGSWPWIRCAAVTLAPWLLAGAGVMAGLHQLDRGGWLIYRLSGLDVIPLEKPQSGREKPVTAFLAEHPTFVQDPSDPTRIVLRTGDYTFDRTAIVPVNATLIIEPGTTLRFGAGCSLISYSPVVAHGTADRPIAFTAANAWRKWGAVVLLDAGHAEFEHVRFEHARQVSLNGTPLPGGLSLIDTDAEIRNSRFENMFGKDAVYVLRGQVSICDNWFRNAHKDGLDLDDGTGTITGNVFIDCADEGIDLSSVEQLIVSGNTIRDRRGGRIGVEGDAAQFRLANTFEYSNRP